MAKLALELSNKVQIRVLSGDGSRVTPVRELCESYGVDALIRLHRDDFNEFMKLRGFFTHFNLERTLNEIGKRYAVLPIIRAGYRDAENREVLPVVDAAQYRKGLCMEVIQSVPIKAVDARFFTNSLPSIQSPDHLRASLLRRYRPMFPEKSEDELLSRGCGISVLRLDA